MSDAAGGVRGHRPATGAICRKARKSLIRALSPALALISGACAHPLPQAAAPPDLRGWDRAVDWQAAGAEAVRVLSAYLQVDTQNPPGNETEGAIFLARILQSEGIPSEIIEFAPGRGSLVARLPRTAGGGVDPGPLCLLSHIDTATADASEWPEGKGPLSGKVDQNGEIWGRGALDMKGMGALELLTMVWLRRLGVPLRREVVLLAVADEEVNNQGMRLVVERYWDRIGCTHVINEGGLGLKDALFEGHTTHAISVAEKGVLWLRVTVQGKGGHGSTPMPDNAVRKLVGLLRGLERRKPRPRIHPAFKAFFARVGAARGGATELLLSRPVLVRTLLGGRLMDNPGTRAAITDTINLTGLSTGGNEPNVVPSKASATLDCRLLPGTPPEAVEAEVRELLGNDPTLTIERLFYAPARESPWEDDPVFEALARRAVDGRQGVSAGPVLSVGFTDSIYAREKGARAYGLVPFEVTAKEAETMHAKDERVSVKNVHRGLRTLLLAVLDVAADLSGPCPIEQPLRPPRGPGSGGGVVAGQQDL